MPGKRKQRDLERPAANTSLGQPRIKQVRVHGGGKKVRALQLSHGNFAVASEGISAKCAILEVLYNPAGNELVRRGIITKGCIVKINPAPLLVKTSSSHEEQLRDGLACVSSRPGKTGRADGYILEGQELAFYRKQINT